MRYGVSGHMTALHILNLVLIYDDIPFKRTLEVDCLQYSSIVDNVHT